METKRSPSSLLRANTTLVHYPRFNELHADIRLCQEVSQLAGEPQCMVLEGVAGAGKSTLVKTYAEFFHAMKLLKGPRFRCFIWKPHPLSR